MNSMDSNANGTESGKIYFPIPIGKVAMNISKFTSFLVAIFVLNAAHAAEVATPKALTGNIEAGKAKSAVCAACHGMDGNSVNPIWPDLAGQNARYLLQQLKDIKTGKSSGRENPVMQPIVANLTDQDMVDLAAYFASLPAKTGGKADPKLIDTAQKLYRAGNREREIPACLSCHGPEGNGNASGGYPKIAGQHAAYTEIQLKAFRDKTRHNDPNHMMTDVAHNLTDDEIKALASYIEGLH